MNTSLKKKQRSLDLDVLFGIELAKMRKKCGASQEFVAREIGVTRSVISKIERGHRALAANEMGDYAKAVQVPFLVFCETLQGLSIEYDEDAARKLLEEEREGTEDEGTAL